MIEIRLINSNSFASKIIRAGMWLWTVSRGLPRMKTYGHLEIVFEMNGILMSSGATATEGGANIRTWADYIQIYHFNHTIDYISYPLLLTKNESDLLIQYLEKAEGEPYEFENFFWHLIKILTGKWEGSTTTRQIYCYEHGIRALLATGKYDLDIFMNPYQFREWADENLI